MVSGAPPIRPDALVFGIGNSGRSDDGLGWAFLDRLRESAVFSGEIEYRYQLQAEDAARVSEATQVVFVDACRGALPCGFRWRRCEAAANWQFSTHALPPQVVMSLCRSLYPALPAAELLMIQGLAWDLGSGLSAAAEANLEAALESFRGGLRAGAARTQARASAAHSIT